MIYLEFEFDVQPLELGVEILIAELGYAGFESFEETETGVLAYINKEDWKEDLFEDIFILKNEDFEISYTQKEIEQINWNEEWEKNFQAIEVDGKVYVRAPFHEAKDVEYEIVIEPKMAFGTGHHETTYMMMQYILEEDMQDKVVLDMGCGTSVLAILASKKGAKDLDAIDIDSWCYDNSVENIERNQCPNIQAYQGVVDKLDELSDENQPKYHTILANINRNVLLADIPAYAKHIKPAGHLFVSGFYLEDLPLIQEVANKAGLKFVSNKQRNKWISAKFEKE